MLLSIKTKLKLNKNQATIVTHIKSVDIGMINLSLLFLRVLSAFVVKSFRYNRN